MYLQLKSGSSSKDDVVSRNMGNRGIKKLDKEELYKEWKGTVGRNRREAGTEQASISNNNLF